jgi:hypothetical protein
LPLSARLHCSSTWRRSYSSLQPESGKGTTVTGWMASLPQQTSKTGRTHSHKSLLPSHRGQRPSNPHL